MENYKSKIVTAEAAVAAAVKDGDWVDYGFGGGFPELLDKALAARKGHLRDVKIRGGLVIRPRIEVVEADPEQESFSYYSWHISDYERKLRPTRSRKIHACGTPPSPDALPPALYPDRRCFRPGIRTG